MMLSARQPAIPPLMESVSNSPKQGKFRFHFVQTVMLASHSFDNFAYSPTAHALDCIAIKRACGLDLRRVAKTVYAGDGSTLLLRRQREPRT